MADANPAMTYSEPQEPRDTRKQVVVRTTPATVVAEKPRPVITRVRKGRKPKPFVMHRDEIAAPEAKKAPKKKATTKKHKKGAAV